MTSWVKRYGALIASAAGADVPLALLLGHVQHESGGKPTDHTKLDERGLFQIHPGTSKQFGYDHSRLFDPAYNVWAGVDMYKRMAARLQKDYSSLFPRRDDFFWHVVRFEFSIGSGALRKILREMAAHGVRPRSWTEFEDYLRKNRDTLFHLTKHDPVKWAQMVKRVFDTGERLAHGTVVAVAGGGVLTVGLLIAVTVYFLSRRNSARMI